MDHDLDLIPRLGTRAAPRPATRRSWSVLRACLILCLVPWPVQASSRLLYLELQGVAGYDLSSSRVIHHSLGPEEAMQKSSLGFDYLEKIASETADIATLAVQGRLAWDPDRTSPLDPQLYNGTLKVKTPWLDAWVGHDRPALGSGAYFDSHALLLPAPAMLGFGLDRDWGLGAMREFEQGDLALSWTTGSGMPLSFGGNYLLAARGSWGMLAQDNTTVGLSLAYGRVLETMGDTVMSPDPREQGSVILDAAWLWDNFELRAETLLGREQGDAVRAGFVRFGASWLEEGTLRTEAQVLARQSGEELIRHWACGLSWALTPDWTLRSMFLSDPEGREQRIVLQAYGYFRLL